jgi:hypothetical protein
MVEKICTQNKAGKKVYVLYENIFTLEKCISFKQRNDKTTTEFSAQVNVMYDSIIHQNGCTSFGESFLVTVLECHGVAIRDHITLSQEYWDPYDYKTRDLTVAMLIKENSNHDCARNKIKTYIILDRVLMRLGVWNRFSCIIIFVEHVMGIPSVDSSW